MSDQLLCWKCGEPLLELILPMSRREECAACGADQHVCKLCKDYKPTVADACTEERADRVNDKERANFCDYFSPDSHAFQGRERAQEQQARAQLAQLFGDDSEDDPEQQNTAAPLSESDAALAELEKLFNKD